ncbi:MAG: hypothetical protein ABSA15_01220 [Thermoplasmata archaeon]|jgi:cytochrome c oxidase subunit 2
MVNISKLEIAWTLAVVVILAGVVVYSTFLLYNLDALAPNPSEYVQVIGHQWYWEFCYSNDTCYNSTYDASTNTVSGGALWAAPGSVVQINVTGADVIHSFNIPGLGVRIDAIPGRMNTIQFSVPTVPAGTQFLIQCTEFCGTFHGTMRSFLIVT